MLIKNSMYYYLHNMNDFYLELYAHTPDNDINNIVLHICDENRKYIVFDFNDIKTNYSLCYVMIGEMTTEDEKKYVDHFIKILGTEKQYKFAGFFWNKLVFVDQTINYYNVCFYDSDLKKFRKNNDLYVEIQVFANSEPMLVYCTRYYDMGLDERLNQIFSIKKLLPVPYDKEQYTKIRPNYNFYIIMKRGYNTKRAIHKS